MTFIAAWKTEEAIFVAGDSAVTRTGFSLEYLKNRKKKTIWKTNFDEQIVLNENRIVDEFVVKIHNIKNKLIIGYAGRGNQAIDVINLIENQFNPDMDNIQEIIEEGANMYGSAFQMAVGYFIGKIPYLLTYNLNSNSEFSINNSWALLGSGRNNEALRLLTVNTMDYLNRATSHNSAEEKLLQFCTLVQSLLLRGQFINEGVGGFFTGGYLTPKGFSWQSDTGYITFLLSENHDKDSSSPNILFTNPRFIFLFHRENKAAILSLKEEVGYQVMDIYFPHINSFDLQLYGDRYKREYEQWITKYGKELKKRIRKFNLKYFVLFTYDIEALNKMTFIHNYFGCSNFIIDIYWNSGIPTLNITKEFVKTIDPRSAEALNDFQWVTQKKVWWYIHHLFHYLIQKMYFAIKKPRIKE